MLDDTKPLRPADSRPMSRRIREPAGGIPPLGKIGGVVEDG